MAWRDSCTNVLKACKSVGKYLLFPLLALGKLVNSGAQTSSGITYSINYCRHITAPPGTSPYAKADGLTLALSSVALVANFELTAVTRIPALKKVIFDDLPAIDEGFHYADLCSENAPIYLPAYLISTLSAYSSCVFSTVNSWLFGRTLTELCFMLAHIPADDPEWKATINQLGLIASTYAASCSSTSFYSYNILKIQKNAKKMADKLLGGDWHWASMDHKTRRNVQKTIAYSILNIFSTATFSYFSTKKAIPRFVSDLNHGALIDEDTVILIAALSTITTFTTSAFTTTPAAYKWMSRDANAYNHFSDQSQFFKLLRLSTLYFFGIIDSISTGLGNFRGGADLFYDLFKLPHYSFLSVFLSSICAATGAFSNKVFNVDEGFEDFRSDRIHRIESSRQLLPTTQEENPQPAEVEMLVQQPAMSSSDEDSDEEMAGTLQASREAHQLDLSFLKEEADSSSSEDEDEEDHQADLSNEVRLLSLPTPKTNHSPLSLIPAGFFTSNEYVSFFSPRQNAQLTAQHSQNLNSSDRQVSTFGLSAVTS